MTLRDESLESKTMVKQSVLLFFFFFWVLFAFFVFFFSFVPLLVFFVFFGFVLFWLLVLTKTISFNKTF